MYEIRTHFSGNVHSRFTEVFEFFNVHAEKMRVTPPTIASTREMGHPDLGGINRSMEVITARQRYHFMY